VFTGLIEGFRRMTLADGVRGKVFRRLSHWLEQGVRR
jgi:hypothetical protein